MAQSRPSHTILLTGFFGLCTGLLLHGAEHTLKVTPQTIAWGYYWAAAKPVLTVQSGDIVEIRRFLRTSVARVVIC
jgi:hypothetical protein